MEETIKHRLSFALHQCWPGATIELPFQSGDALGRVHEFKHDCCDSCAVLRVTDMPTKKVTVHQVLYVGPSPEVV